MGCLAVLAFSYLIRYAIPAFVFPAQAWVQQSLIQQRRVVGLLLFDRKHGF